MVRLISVLIFVIAPNYILGQPVIKRPVVYQLPAMSKVTTKEKIEFRKVRDTSLTLDIYYPPGFDGKKSLPAVIFNNGVGVMDIPQWRVYQDWAKLMAAHGLIAINYQGRRGSALDDSEALIDFVVSNAAEYNIDPEKLGIWTCSANTRVGMRLAHKSRPKNIRALVVYYGSPDSLGRLRQDLPTLIVRAGLDAQGINQSIERFAEQSFYQDTRLEVINYLEGIHAFDIFTNTEESKAVIIRTIAFMKSNLEKPVPLQTNITLTNRNFMWLIKNNQLQEAVSEFRKAREKYRADSTFQPFYNGVIREDVLNANAYILLRDQRQNEALELFKLLVESYPESPNAYDGLADAYEALGNKAEALANAQKALVKLETATNLSPQFKEAVKKSASEKLSRLKTGS